MSEEEELPEGWAETRIDQLMEFERGVSFSKTQARSEPGEGLVPVLRAGNIQNGRILWDDLLYVPANLVRDEQAIRPGDVVVAMSSGSATVVGKAAAVSPADASTKAAFGAFCGLWRPLEPSPSGWLQAYFQTSEYRRAVSAAALGVNINNLRAEHIGSLAIRVPPLNEQRRIVAKLEDLLARSRRAKDALDAIPPLLEKLRQSILAAAFRGDLTADWRAQHPDVEPAEELLKRIRIERRKKWEEAELAKLRAKGKPPTDDRWKAKYQEPEGVDADGLPELPEGWCWANVGTMSALITSGSRGWADYYSDVGPLFIRSQDINTDALSLDGIAHVAVPDDGEGARTRVQQGDILVTITGANVTRSAPVLADIGEAYVSQHVGLVRLVDSSFAALLHLWLIAEHGGRGQLKRRAYGLGKPGLNLDDLASVHVPLPPLVEQKRIVESVTAALRGAARAHEHLAALSHAMLRLDSGVLRKSFRGELVEQDPSDEPASAMLERLAAAQSDTARDASKRAPKRAKRGR